MHLYKTVAGLRSALASRRDRRAIGLVPTMGALHLGHASLIQRAVAENDIVVVSIFVNPLQFGPSEDLQEYPRQLEKDCRVCEQYGVDIVFAPTVEEMGTPPSQESPSSTVTAVVPPPEMTSVLCGQFRPGHFQGVATIVTKLFNIIAPNNAYFGEKDAQQLAILRRVVKDLNIPVEVKACPTVREASGLALSSRNQYLSETEREQAKAIYRSLQAARKAFCTGEREAFKLINIVKQELALTPEVKVQYVELVHPQTLTRLEKIEEAGLLAIAAYVGSTRLIDNVILRHRRPIIAIDGPAGAGKSTVTRRVAQSLNLLHLDTGAMYRAVAWLVMRSGISLDDEGAIAELVTQANLELIPAEPPNPTRVKINGEDVTETIRTPEVTAIVSQIAAKASVRQALVQQQQRYGKTGGIVAEGRDIGTAVFPDAELKIFLTASVEERAKRRWQDFKEQGREEISLEQLEQDIQARDYFDSHREIAPLQQAIDAIKIDTDKLSIEEVTEQIINLYEQLDSKA
ncbi:cytidylate kinase [Hydrococcus rivularis NIES-593]|uniref:Bifunctional pantoate ligase/cytidylate kinase n=1 Tax=Hydrococcus rivularis NIES-593 TaxID=1921803 RepID=A0A1U7HQZ3_9CYAN|nr:bifunctional pantoate--beta-alanine ligase/(d)CMP kinase [Hydrococcus rivularis]OKH25979.1 cytidylate kinase [Hydrococcus rivularis NIES-593]